MTPKNIHIGIEQILQNINSNIYSSFLPEEIDLQFNTICDKFITYIFKGKISKGDEYIFQDVQRDFDNLRLLLQVNKFYYLVNNQVNLPTDYRDSANTTSLVNRLCCQKVVNSGNIESDKYYKNNSSVIIVYNNQNVLSNQVFLGVEDISTFIYGQSPYTGNIIELVKSDNRLTETETKQVYLKASFTKPSWESPVIEIANNLLKIYKDNTFKVEGILMDYLRILNPLDSVNNLNVDWNTEFPNETQKVLIDMTARRLMFITDSNRYQVSTVELAK